MATITKITVHCSATKASWLMDQPNPLEKQIAEIKRWHVEDNGWSDIGYHHLIGRKGEHGLGTTPETSPGAHVGGMNTGNIGVCLIGGRGSSADDRIDQHFTEAQIAALKTLLLTLKKRYPGATIHGHNEFDNKACPGFDVQAWLRTWLPQQGVHVPELDRPVLRSGARGVSVADAQTMLREKGYQIGEVDGIFGSATRAAVLAFQSDHGLRVDGVVGGDTWGALRDDTKARPVAPHRRLATESDLRAKGSTEIRNADAVQGGAAVAAGGVTLEGMLSRSDDIRDALTTVEGIGAKITSIGAEVWPILIVIAVAGFIVSRMGLMKARRVEKHRTGEQMNR